MKNKRKGSFLADRQFALERLAAKIDKAREFLKDRLEGLLQLRRDRTEAFLKCKREIEESTARWRGALEHRNSLHLEADQIEADAEEMLEQIQLIRLMAIETPVEQRRLDLADSEREIIRCRYHWRQIFKAKLDGKTRRKRGELARLQARAVRKLAATKKLVDGTTPTATEIVYGVDGALPIGTGNEDLGRTRLQIDTKKHDPVNADPVSSEVK